MQYKREKTAMCLRDDQLGKMWKIAAVALVACVAVAALAWFRPWEREIPKDEPLKMELYEYAYVARFILVSTDDNLPIENVKIYTPFFQTFENLRFNDFLYITPYGAFFMLNKNELIATGRTVPITRIVEVEHVMKSSVEICTFRPGESVSVGWIAMIPENTTYLTVPGENICTFYVDFSPDKEIVLGIELRQTPLPIRIGDDGFPIIKYPWAQIVTGSGWFSMPSL
jgi:hypothetical protein